MKEYMSNEDPANQEAAPPGYGERGQVGADIDKNQQQEEVAEYVQTDATDERDGDGQQEQEKVRGSPGALKAPRPVVICGPSGVGKGTLINKLMAEFPKTCGFSVSHTTRKPRPGEIDGVHYHFTSKETMETEIADGKFLEYATVHGNLYGTSVAAVEYVLASGKTCILDIDVQGAEKVKRSIFKALYVFIAPPSMEALELRLRGRATETEEAVLKRLKNAKQEVERSAEPKFFDHIFVNDNLEECYNQLKQTLYLEPKPVPSAQNATPTLAPSSEVPAPSHRSGQAAVVLGAKVLCTGGVSEDLKLLNDVHCLDLLELDGGAPMQTRGLRCLPVSMTPLTGTKPLSPLLHHNGVALSDREALFVGQEAVDESVIVT